MAEIASAFVSLVPSAKGFGKGIDKEIGGQVKSSGSKMGGLLGKGLKVGALGVAGAAGAAIGTALFKGFGRLQGIDQAEAKLKGLGHTTKGVDKIMENALTSVKGTAFGLDAAATSAAGAVAAGVKPGKELERNLKLVGDAATIAGTDMGTMGSIFNKVAASDMIQGDVLAQLGDAGIPVLQMLGKEMGVSATEVRKLASEGKINFATFQDAMESGLGGAAQESGKTFAGSMANMQAALGRLGANVLGGVFAKMPAVFGSVTTALDKLGPVATRVGEAIGGAFTRVGPAVKTMQSALAPLGAAVSNVARAFGFLFDPKDTDAARGFGEVIDYVFGNTGKLVAPLRAVGDVLRTVIQEFQNGMPTIRAAFGQLVATLQTHLLPVLRTAATTFSTIILPAVVGFATYVGSALLPVFRQVWGILSGQVIPIVASLARFLYGTLYPAVAGIVIAVGKNLRPVFDQLVKTFRSQVLPTVTKLLAKFREWQPTIQRVIGVVVKVVGAVLKLAAAILGKVLPVVIRFAGWLLGKVVPAVAAVIGVVVKVVGKMVDFGSAMIKGGQKVAEFATKVNAQITKVLGWFTGLPGKVKEKLSGAATWLVQAGKDIIHGLGNGIYNEARDWLAAKVQAVAGWIPGWIKKRLGIASPSKVTMALGVEVARGLGAGMENGRGGLKKSAEKMLKALGGGKGEGWLATIAKGIKLETPKAVKAAQEAFDKIKGAITSKRDDLRSTLDGFKSDFAAIADSVSSAFAGGLFDVSASDTASAGQSFVDNLMGKKSELTALMASFKTLKGWGLDPEFLTGLFASGNGALITDLAAMTPGGALDAATLFGEVTELGKGLGTAVAENDPVSARIDVTNDKLDKVVAALDYLASDIGKELNGAAAKARRKKKAGKK